MIQLTLKNAPFWLLRGEGFSLRSEAPRGLHGWESWEETPELMGCGLELKCSRKRPGMGEEGGNELLWVGMEV